MKFYTSFATAALLGSAILVNTSFAQTDNLTTAPHTVTIQDFAFIPETTNVAVGNTVTWANGDSVTHNVEFTAKAPAKFKSKDIEQNGSASYTFTKAGTYHYRCSYHPNMTGTIKVTDNASSANKN
ncbi:MAG: putative Copper binding protein plastocyanin/azurin family, precursor [Gammaproteobacteria bacterium]|jgi:plastocyanin|nr:putative Copper binding protein plastocyanin/azurin family, precursor [Gammaproteobacteria bacterium]